jgi:hypothetical protein
MPVDLFNSKLALLKNIVVAFWRVLTPGLKILDGNQRKNG